jgi:hypothetical protein
MRIFVVKKNTLIRAAIFLLLVIGAIVYTQVAFRDAKPASTESAVVPVCRVATGRQGGRAHVRHRFWRCRLHGADPRRTEGEGAPATFFVMGLWANEYPEKMDALAQSGCEIASHSMNHTAYTELTETEMLSDAAQAAELIFDATGYDTELLRLPYGKFDTRTIMALQAQGYIPLKWSLDSKDWKGLSADKIADTVLSQAESGDIIMFQNNVPATPEALGAVIQGLKEQGFTLVTVSAC